MRPDQQICLKPEDAAGTSPVRSARVQAPSIMVSVTLARIGHHADTFDDDTEARNLGPPSTTEYSIVGRVRPCSPYCHGR